jgi:hypothetical protein
MNLTLKKLASFLDPVAFPLLSIEERNDAQRTILDTYAQYFPDCVQQHREALNAQSKSSSTSIAASLQIKNTTNTTNTNNKMSEKQGNNKINPQPKTSNFQNFLAACKVTSNKPEIEKPTSSKVLTVEEEIKLYMSLVCKSKC